MNIFHSTGSFLKRLRSGVRQDPARDWLLLLSISTVALVCIIIWNVWAFGTVTNGGTIGTAATGTPPVFNKASLDAIHAIFTSRATEENNYINGTYQFADPSQ
ncbi:MAG: hypothetical protein KGH79_04990 [Patescibacteria group bacterium]|nr:hypothetical protein [Patescibacteria group bacterium]